MSEDYVLTKDDFEAIEEGITVAYDERLKHVFPRGLGDMDLVSYDSKSIYLWSRNDYPDLEKIRDSVCQFKIYRFSHNLTLSGNDYEKVSLTTGGIKIGGIIFNNLPSSLNIQCAPLTTRAKPKLKQHYRAIVVHEFGHFYFDQNVQHPFLEQLLNLVGSSAELSESELANLLNPPNLSFLSELFATLTELETLKIFYPNFLEKAIKKMDLYVKKGLDIGPREQKILLAKNDHIYAKILAPRIFKSFPNWPQMLHSLF